MPDRKNNFEDFKSIRQGLQQFLEDESLTNEIDTNSDVRSWRFYRSSTRLPVCGKVARVALGGGSLSGRGMVPEGVAFSVDG